MTPADAIHIFPQPTLAAAFARLREVCPAAVDSAADTVADGYVGLVFAT